MLCTNEPYNENDDIRITKSGCYDYTFTNLSICPQTITVTRLNSGSVPYTATVEVAGLSVATVTLPGDGIYSVTGVNTEDPCLYLNVTATQDLTLDVLHIAVFEFPLSAAADPVEVVRDTVQAVNAYYAVDDGAASLTAPTNMLNALNAYGIATTKQFQVQLASPSTSFTGGWDVVFSNTDNWRLLVAYIGTEIDCVTINGQNYSPSVYACAYFANSAPAYDFVTQVTVDGEEQMVVPNFYDLTDGDQYEALRSLIIGEISSSGTPFDVPGPDEIAGVIVSSWADCPEVVIQFADGETVEHPIQWCTTLFEFCKLWNCVQTKLAQWLCCTDPCVQTCDNKPMGDEWLDLMMQLTMWGMVPLLTEHRLWQFGNLTDDQGANLARLQPTLALWDRWYKMVEGCGCQGTTPCSGCAGAGTLIPQSPIINPVTGGDCGCGC